MVAFNQLVKVPIGAWCYSTNWQVLQQLSLLGGGRPNRNNCVWMGKDGLWNVFVLEKYEMDSVNMEDLSSIAIMVCG